MSTKDTWPDNIPYGHCQCGCGRITNLIDHNVSTQGLVKGEHRRFVVGHKPKRVTSSAQAELRFWSKVDKSGDCWLWTGRTKPDGYGVFKNKSPDGRWVHVYAHRFSYEAVCGPIPEGLTIDHLCRVRNCVNPDHLDPVTRIENMRRSRKPECRRGHNRELASGPNWCCRACENGTRWALKRRKQGIDTTEAEIQAYADASYAKMVERGGKLR